mgnify:CR=1 FL=1
MTSLLNWCKRALFRDPEDDIDLPEQLMNIVQIIIGGVNTSEIYKIAVERNQVPLFISYMNKISDDINEQYDCLRVCNRGDTFYVLKSYNTYDTHFPSELVSFITLRFFIYIELFLREVFANTGIALNYDTNYLFAVMCSNTGVLMGNSFLKNRSVSTIGSMYNNTLAHIVRVKMNKRLFAIANEIRPKQYDSDSDSDSDLDMFDSQFETVFNEYFIDNCNGHTGPINQSDKDHVKDHVEDNEEDHVEDHVEDPEEDLSDEMSFTDIDVEGH